MASLPELTPSMCLGVTDLKDFLRLSRARMDDTVSVQLNALATHTPYDPEATRMGRLGAGGSTVPDARACTMFEQHLVAEWQRRSSVLAYCAQVAASSVAEAPPAPSAQPPPADDSDERYDPYARRPRYRYDAALELQRVVRSENVVEDILRDRSWAQLRARCPCVEPSWQAATLKTNNTHVA